MSTRVSSNEMKKHLRQTIYIGFGGGLFQGFLSREDFLSGANWEADLFTFGFAASIWIMLWKGNELMVNIISLRYSWLDNPGKRLVIGIVVMIMYSLLAAFSVYALFFGLIRGHNIFTDLENVFNTFLIFALGITTVISSFAHGISFLKSWRQSEINVERLKKEKLASQYEALRSQLNPHFLFNSLNALTSLVYDDQDKAAKFINELSKVYRYVLDVQKMDVVRLSDEMAFVQSYFYLQKIRFGDNLHLEVNLGASCLSKYLPPLAVQLLLENAIKHNVISVDEPLRIVIDCENDELLVVNKINKKNIAIEDKDHSGLGLSNIKVRYQHLSQKEVRIDQTNGYFKVKLPLLKFDIDE